MLVTESLSCSPGRVQLLTVRTPTLLRHLPLLLNPCFNTSAAPHLPLRSSERWHTSPWLLPTAFLYKNPGSQHWEVSILQPPQVVFSWLHSSRTGPPQKGTLGKATAAYAKPPLCHFQPSSSCLAPLHPKFHCSLFLLLLTSTPRHLSILRSSCLTQPITDNSGTTITTTHWKSDIFFSPLLPTSTEQNVFWEPGHKSETCLSTLPVS